MNCLICNYEGDKLQITTTTELNEVDCPRCGSYLYTDSSRGKLVTQTSENKSKLSVINRNSNILGRDLIEFDTVNIQRIIDNHVELSVPEKTDKLLLNLSLLASAPNDEISINESLDWPLAFAKDSSEMSYYLTYLRENDLIHFTGQTQDANKIEITVKGWRYIGELQKTVIVSNKAFIAMNFEKEFSDVYDKAIKPAVESCGYKPIRVDREEHVNLIDDYIMAEIKESRFVVAEFTGQKHGVYFEAGYARGLGIPVIWVCRKDDLKNLHFDTNHYNQIDWKTHEELEKRLNNRIRAVI